MTKKIKPRRNDGKRTFDLVIKESNVPIHEVKDRRFKNLEEIMEMLNKKL